GRRPGARARRRARALLPPRRAPRGRHRDPGAPQADPLDARGGAGLHGPGGRRPRRPAEGEVGRLRVQEPARRVSRAAHRRRRPQGPPRGRRHGGVRARQLRPQPRRRHGRRRAGAGRGGPRRDALQGRRTRARVAPLGVLMRGLLLALLVLACGLVVASRFWPKVEHVVVAGNERFTAEQVAAMARVRVGDPFLWVTRSSVGALEEEPWVLDAAVVRRWPDTVEVRVTERTPVMSVGVGAWAADGTVLPGVPADEAAASPVLRGWGEDRTAEALELERLLRPFGVQVISYSP